MEIHAAPMAGFTDHAFRRVLAKLWVENQPQADSTLFLYTEMVSATALFHQSKKTLPLLGMDKCPRIRNVVQLFGKTPEHFTYAIKSGLLDNFDEININMGCPAKKIIKNSEGCFLMTNPTLARQIIRACVTATTKPVTVKMRLGFDEKTNSLDQAITLAKICEDEGIAYIIIHGRYASQGYSGTANHSAIATVVSSTTLPVITNGDIRCPDSATAALETTGARGVMIGRAMLGAPWMLCFEKPNNVLDIVNFHLEQAKQLGTYFGELKKHLLLYANSFPNSRQLKLEIVKWTCYTDVKWT